MPGHQVRFATLSFIRSVPSNGLLKLNGTLRRREQARQAPRMKFWPAVLARWDKNSSIRLGDGRAYPTGRALVAAGKKRLGFHAALMELLGLLVTASPLASNLRDVRAENGAARRDDLIGPADRFIGDHIAEPVRVVDLARHAKMSTSAFAYAYPRLAGEFALSHRATAIATTSKPAH